MTVSTDIAGLPVELLPERAAFLPDHNVLLVADLHLSKGATFRARGIPIPRGSSVLTLERLSALLRLTGPARLIILGDLFHGREASHPGEMDAFFKFRERHRTLPMSWVLGNHDRHVKNLDIGCDVVQELSLGDWRLSHHPVYDERPTVCGHIHPGYRLGGRGRASEMLPCFYQSGSCLVLPAFGEFTGLAAVEPSPEDRIHVIAGRSVLTIPPGALSAI